MQIRLPRLLAVATAAWAAFAGFAAASTVTLTFTSGNLEDFGTFSQDGYTFTDVSGNSVSPSNADILNNAVFDFFFAVGETMSITNDAGDAFTFDGFGFAAASSTLSDGFQILGFLNETQVVNYGNFTSTSTSFTNILTGDDTEVDEIRIIGIDVNATGVFWDNFQLTTVAPVPLPAGVMLLIGGLALLALLRRRGTQPSPLM